jgi:hypothetical protein
MSGKKHSTRSRGAVDSASNKLFEHQHTWMSWATIVEVEEISVQSWFSNQKNIPPREESVHAIRHGVVENNSKPVNVYYLRNVPDDNLRLTAREWLQLSNIRNSTIASQSQPTFAKGDLIQLRTYLACDSNITDEQVAALAVSRDNDFRFSVPVHEPKQVESQTNEVRNDPEGSPLLGPAMASVVNRFNKSKDSRLDNIVQEIDIAAVVVGYELLVRGPTPELCKFIRHSFPDTSEDEKVVHATCVFIAREHVHGNDEFWQRAFYDTVTQRNKVLHGTVLGVLGGATTPGVDSFVKSMNSLQDESKRRADEKEKAKLSQELTKFLSRSLRLDGG